MQCILTQTVDGTTSWTESVIVSDSELAAGMCIALRTTFTVLYRNRILNERNKVSVSIDPEYIINRHIMCNGVAEEDIATAEGIHCPPLSFLWWMWVSDGASRYMLCAFNSTEFVREMVSIFDAYRLEFGEHKYGYIYGSDGETYGLAGYPM